MLYKKRPEIGALFIFYFSFFFASRTAIKTLAESTSTAPITVRALGFSSKTITPAKRLVIGSTVLRMEARSSFPN